MGRRNDGKADNGSNSGCGGLEVPRDERSLVAESGGGDGEEVK